MFPAQFAALAIPPITFNPMAIQPIPREVHRKTLAIAIGPIKSALVPLYRSLAKRSYGYFVFSACAFPLFLDRDLWLKRKHSHYGS